MQESTCYQTASAIIVDWPLMVNPHYYNARTIYDENDIFHLVKKSTCKNCNVTQFNIVFKVAFIYYSSYDTSLYHRIYSEIYFHYKIGILQSRFRYNKMLWRIITDNNDASLNEVQDILDLL